MFIYWFTDYQRPMGEVLQWFGQDLLHAIFGLILMFYLLYRGAGNHW